jgi:predicted transcriptional regulator with HTH domain
MKHIKTYTLYERVSKETKVFESTEQDLKDILLELKDMGYRVIYEDDVKGAVTGEPGNVKGAVTGEPGNVKAIIVRDVMRPSDWIELPWSELKEYALRIKDYLGDKYLSFMWRKVISDNPGTLGDNPYKTVELNDDTQIDDRVWSFVIKYKE